jgi:uncharacterized membrane protein
MAYTPEEIEEGKSAAILAYIPFLCLIPLVKWRQNRFAYDHARQGTALFLIEIIAVILLIPGLAVLLVKLVLTAAIFLAIIGIIYVLQNEPWKIPYIGDWINKLIGDKTDEYNQRDLF